MTQEKTKKARMGLFYAVSKNQKSRIDDSQDSFLLKMLYACLFVMFATMAVVLIIVIAMYQDVP